MIERLVKTLVIFAHITVLVTDFVIVTLRRRTLNYICLHESGLSSLNLWSRFHSGMKLGMKLTFIVAEMKYFCEIERFIHVLKCISAKIAETIRVSVHKSGMIFNPE